MHQWASFIRSELCVPPKADPAAYDWVLASVPSAYAIRMVLSKTSSLLDKRANDLSAALALLDGHVVRTDGHFKVPRKIITKAGAGATGFMIAYFGSSGFLLKEVSIVESESCANYLGGMESILLARRDRGLAPPDVICDNPSVIEGKLGDFVKDIWCCKSTENALAGDPAHRKIELEQSIDSTHQDAMFGIRDFSYIVKRLGHLLDTGACSNAMGAIDQLEIHLSDLHKLKGEAKCDPFSKEFPPIAPLRRKNVSTEAYIALLKRNGEAVDTYPSCAPSRAASLRAFFSAILH